MRDKIITQYNEKSSYGWTKNYRTQRQERRMSDERSLQEKWTPRRDW